MTCRTIIVCGTPGRPGAPVRSNGTFATCLLDVLLIDRCVPSLYCLLKGSCFPRSSDACDCYSQGCFLLHRARLPCPSKKKASQRPSLATTKCQTMFLQCLTKNQPKNYTTKNQRKDYKSMQPPTRCTAQAGPVVAVVTMSRSACSVTSWVTALNTSTTEEEDPTTQPVAEMLIAGAAGGPRPPPRCDAQAGPLVAGVMMSRSARTATAWEMALSTSTTGEEGPTTRPVAREPIAGAAGGRRQGP